MPISAFEHPFLSGLAGDGEVSAFLGINAEIDAMLAFEIALAKAEAAHGVIPADAAAAIEQALHDFRPDIASLREGVARDGVVIPDFVRQLKDAVGKPHAAHIHYGATSQDVIDTALVLRLRPVIELFDKRIDGILTRLDSLSERFGTRRLMGRTRMQAAIPITVADRIEAWRAPVLRDRARLDRAAYEVLVVQFGGAAGTLEKLGTRAAPVRATLAATLGLGEAEQWHSQRDRVAAFADVLSLITGALGKIGQDVALLAQDGGEIRLSGGGGSSAMPHKQNPVQAEFLTTLARYNATQLSAIHHALVHEQERSGAAWTLEWLALPPMMQATGAALMSVAKLLDAIAGLGTE